MRTPKIGETIKKMSETIKSLMPIRVYLTYVIRDSIILETKYIQEARLEHCILMQLRLNYLVN